MEVLPYLRSRPRALAVLLLVPLLAAGAAFSLVRADPSGFAGRVSVSVPPGADGSSGQIVLFAADFGLALGSREVLEGVAGAAGESLGDAASSVEFDRLGQSSSIAVTYTGDTAEGSRRGAAAAAQGALLQLAAGERDRRAAEVTRLEAELDTRSQAVQALQDRTGLLFPVEEYEDVTSQLRDAQLAQQRAQLLGSSTGVTSAQVDVDALTARQQELAGPAQVFSQQQQLVDATVNSLAGSRQALSGAEAAAQPAAADALVDEPTSSRASDRQRLIQSVVAAAALAFLLTLAVVLAPDLLRRRARPLPLDVEAVEEPDRLAALAPQPARPASVQPGRQQSGEAVTGAVSAQHRVLDHPVERPGSTVPPERSSRNNEERQPIAPVAPVREGTRQNITGSRLEQAEGTAPSERSWPTTSPTPVEIPQNPEGPKRSVLGRLASRTHRTDRPDRFAAEYDRSNKSSSEEQR